MFGFGKSRDYDVRLTDREMRELTSSMDRYERREFEKRQREAEDDREWDMLMMMESFMDD